MNRWSRTHARGRQRCQRDSSSADNATQAASVGTAAVPRLPSSRAWAFQSDDRALGGVALRRMIAHIRRAGNGSSGANRGLVSSHGLVLRPPLIQVVAIARTKHPPFGC
eukprot:2296027-Pleurochrysis_carterae.AAC.1